MITYSERDKYTLIVKVPYKIKDEFKRDFPGVKWDEKACGWILFANATVRERLSIFCDRMSGPAKTAADLQACEYTYGQIKELEFRAVQRNLKLLDELKDAEPLESLLAKLSIATAAYDSVNAKYLEAVANGRKKLRELESTIDKLMAPYDVDGDIATMKKTWEKYSGGLSYVGNEELRAEFEEAKASILDSYNEIHEISGVSLNGLKKLAEIQWENRYGPIPHVVCKEIYRDVEFLSTSAFNPANNYNNKGEHHA